jgi:hypothetical protein
LIAVLENRGKGFRQEAMGLLEACKIVTVVDVLADGMG